MTEHFVEVVATDLIKEKEVYCASIEGISLAIAVSKGNYYAVNNLCSHAASTFDGGRIRGQFLVCPLHGVMFNLENGEPRGTLTKKPIRTYATRVNENSMLEVDISGDE